VLPEVPIDLRSRLRAATRPMHEAIEAELDIAVRLNSIGAYRSFLEDLLRLYRPLEKALQAVAWQGSGIDFDRRRKIGWLEADLIDLKHTRASLDALPDFHREAWPTSLPEALGALYVIEGSTLGGRVILQRLAPILGVSAAWAGSFLNGYGRRTGSMWQAFVASLNAAEAPETDAPIIEASAVATFASFGAALGESRRRQGADEMTAA
jgi:heme oxygenase